MAAAAPDSDSTLAWAFERLAACEAVPLRLLTEDLLAAVGGRDELPDVTRARLLLRIVDEDIKVGGRGAHAWGVRAQEELVLLHGCCRCCRRRCRRTCSLALLGRWVLPERRGAPAASGRQLLPCAH